MIKETRSFKDKSNKNTKNSKSNNVSKKNKAKRVKNSNLVYINKKVKYMKKENKTAVLVVSISLVLFLISIGGSLFKFAFKDKIPTISVYNGSIDVGGVSKGIIIRNEHVYKAPSDGEVNFFAADNEKVRGGDIVASVQNGSVVTNLENQKEKINKEILKKQEQRSNISAFHNDVESINNKLKNYINENMYKFNFSDNSYTNLIKDNINYNINSRNSILLNEGRSDVLQSYVDKNKEIKNKISQNTKDISINRGGIVSYFVDGFEEALTFNNKDNISEEQTEMLVDNSKVTIPKIVNKDHPVFKIIESNEWYIAAYVENNLAARLNEGKLATIYLEKDGEFVPLNMKVSKIVKGEKKSYILLESFKNMIDYLNTRSIKFKTYDTVYNGLKIPETAIAEKTFLRIPKKFVKEDGYGSFVYKVTDEGNKKVYILSKNVMNGKKDSVYIIQQFNDLLVGDKITINSEEYKISDVLTEKGVFKVNNGIATFVILNMEGVIYGDSGYAIISSDRNMGKNGINIYDRIISDAVNNPIKDGDIIN